MKKFWSALGKAIMFGILFVFELIIMYCVTRYYGSLPMIIQYLIFFSIIFLLLSIAMISLGFVPAIKENYRNLLNAKKIATGILLTVLILIAIISFR